jgi:hypothetical protein
MEHRIHSLWLTCIGERKRTFAKAYGIKVRYYGEHEKKREFGTIFGLD